MALTYRDAGVDIDAGDALVERIKPLARPTMRPEVLAGIGGFGGLFALDLQEVHASRCWSPAPTASAPSSRSPSRPTGTTRSGIDLVAMCVNDIAWSAPSRSSSSTTSPPASSPPSRGREVVKGIAEGCRQAGCALIGGETAELPGFYAQGRVRPRRLLRSACVERPSIIDGKRGRPGRRGHRPGLHRAALQRLLAGAQGAAGAATRSTAGSPRSAATGRWPRCCSSRRASTPRSVLALLGAGEGQAIGPHHRRRAPRERAPQPAGRHPRGASRRGAGSGPPIFDLIEREGQVPRDEMYRTFNMGLGLTSWSPPATRPAAIAALREQWPRRLGRRRDREGGRRGHLRGEA